MEKEMFVGAVDLRHVIQVDGALAGGVLLPQTLAQHLGRSLQVDHQVGRGDLVAEQLVVAVVDFQLRVGEVEVGEDLVFFQDVIGYQDAARVGPISRARSCSKRRMRKANCAWKAAPARPS